MKGYRKYGVLFAVAIQDATATSTLMMETEKIRETLVSNSTLTWLIALEDFSICIRRESFKSYILRVTLNEIKMCESLSSGQARK
jgi:hypothetical protein